MTETLATAQLDKLTTDNRLKSSWEQNSEQLSTRIASILGARTLAVAELDATFDPETYDPAFDEDIAA